MKLDLGCGAHKHPGFWGIDRIAMPGVDQVCDFNRGLPLPDNSVEFVMASRSLPYADDMFAILSELYRICTHKAVLCILAPYAHSFRHLSNPFLKQRFDEYTPHYWTNHGVEPFGSANPTPTSDYPGFPVPFDFRLLRMELFYDPPFNSPLYEPEEAEVLNRIQPNVAGEIMYHLVAVKQEWSMEEWQQMCRQVYPEPVWAAALRRDDSPDDGPDDGPDPEELPLPGHADAGETSVLESLSNQEPRPKPNRAKRLKKRALPRKAKRRPSRR